MAVLLSEVHNSCEHTQQLSKAAVVGEGASIRRRIDVLKQKACREGRCRGRGCYKVARGTRRKPPPLRDTWFGGA